MGNHTEQLAFQGKRLLLIDDDAQLLMQCAPRLRRWGFEVIACLAASRNVTAAPMGIDHIFHTEKEFLTIINSVNFDAVLTDVSVLDTNVGARENLNGYNIAVGISAVKPDAPIIIQSLAFIFAPSLKEAKNKLRKLEITNGDCVDKGDDNGLKSAFTALFARVSSKTR